MQHKEPEQTRNQQANVHKGVDAGALTVGVAGCLGVEAEERAGTEADAESTIDSLVVEEE